MTGQVIDDISMAFSHESGKGYSGILKAFEKTGDTLYLDYARKSMNTLYTEVKDGGVTYKDSTGYWYEEYADDNAPAIQGA